MKLKNEQEIKIASRVRFPFLVDRLTIDLLYGFIEGYTQAQQDLLASASEGFEEWYKDHEINGICGGVLNYEETMFGDRHISTSDIDYNCKESWQAASFSRLKEILERTEAVETNREDILPACQEEARIAYTQGLENEIEKLESQNKKLKEALRFYANNVASVWDCNGENLLEECSETARAVLKEMKNEH